MELLLEDNMKNNNSQTKEKSTPMICNECGNHFNKKITLKTTEVKCPKCGGYDTEIK